MAQFKPRQGPKLPPPPTLDLAPENLRAPETAPSVAVDGRSLRATGRTNHQKIVEVLEQGFKLLREK
jgi:hypothetical protein